jgi:hypothetical protein
MIELLIIEDFTPDKGLDIDNIVTLFSARAWKLIT